MVEIHVYKVTDGLGEVRYAVTDEPGDTVSMQIQGSDGSYHSSHSEHWYLPGLVSRCPGATIEKKRLELDFDTEAIRFVREK